MKKNNFILLAAAISMLFCAGQSLAQKDRTARSIDSFLNELHESGKFNGNALVVKNGRKIYERSFGYADGARTTPLTKDHRFNIGSIYKEFPAVAVMQLKEKNLLRIDDSIKKYLPELPAWAERVTIRHLLQYSSGLPTIDWDAYFKTGEAFTEKEILRDLGKIDKLRFEPGTDYLYTNYSPIILINIVERVTKTDFTDYARKNLFAPNRLGATLIKPGYPYEDKKLMALPFDTNFKEDDYRIGVSAVLFTSTAEDLYNWFEKLDTFRVIGRDSVRFLSEKAGPGERVQSPLGLAVWKNGRLVEHSHHGSAVNYETVVRKFPGENLTIAILTNQKHGNVYDISGRIRAIVGEGK